jgi:hypothetical protein
MTDYLSSVIKAQRTTKDLTGEGSSDGMFTALIEGATGITQSGSFTYAGGKRDIALPMPYDGNQSWIRAIPEAGSLVLAGYRADISEPICLNYFNPDPKKRLDAYAKGVSLYRPLQPGEIEINSVGGGQSYYAARPTVDHKAGVIRSWLDQDRLEAGAKAPLHTRLLWEHESASAVGIPGIPYAFNLLGDQEHFGAVRRPLFRGTDPVALAAAKAASALAAAQATESAAKATLSGNPVLAAQYTAFAAKLTAQPMLMSYNFTTYPFPSFTAGATANVATAVASETLAKAAVTLPPGEFQARVFGKEYLRIIKNPLYYPDLLVNNPLVAPFMVGNMNAKLIDIREGQVFDDIGKQVIGTNGTYLRASYKYYATTPAPSSTSVTQLDVDELGNMDWVLATEAAIGWNIRIPAGGLFMTVTGPTGIDIRALTGRVSILATTDVSVTSDSKTSITSGVGFSHTVTSGNHDTTIVAGNHSLAVTGTSSTTVSGSISYTAPSFQVNSTTNISLVSPSVSLISSAEALPTEAMVLGNQLIAWLTKLVTALQKAAPIGNLGAPVLFSSDTILQTALKELATSAATLLSKNFHLSP